MDTAERNRRVMANAGLVYSCVDKFIKLLRTRGHRDARAWRDDLLQEGYIALMNAVSLHDPSKTKLSTYVYTALRNRMLRAWTDLLTLRGPDGMRLALLGNESRPSITYKDCDALDIPDERLPLCPIVSDGVDVKRRVFQLLASRTASLVWARYGEGKLMRELAVEYRLTTQRVSQVLCKGLTRLQADSLLMAAAQQQADVAEPNPLGAILAASRGLCRRVQGRAERLPARVKRYVV